MSTDGPAEKASTSNDLFQFLNSKLEKAAESEKTALTLIRNGSGNLSKADKNGYHPIHLAAMNGSIKVFTALCEKGVSPYSTDENGFTPFYYAKIHKQTEFLAYYEKNYPFDDVPKQQDDQSNEIDEALQDRGLLGYSIELKEPLSLPSYLRGLFIPTLTCTEQNRSKTSKQINPLQLSRIAYGIIEKQNPTNIVRLLTKQLTNQFSSMELNAKLACIFFIKELIRQDSNNESTNNIEFSNAFAEFITNIGNNLAMISLKGKLQSYYQRRMPLPYLDNIEAFTFDLTKLFSDAILRLSPKAFLATNLLMNATTNHAFLTLTKRTNQISQLVCKDIRQASSPQEGAEHFVYYMDVIERCITTHNYAAAFAIYKGLPFNGIEQSILDAYDEAITRYDTLFDRSNKGLRDLMQENPACIPVVAIYLADKLIITEDTHTPLSDRIALFGKLNQQFAEHRDYISSLEAAHAQKDATDFWKHLQHLSFNEIDNMSDVLAHLHVDNTDVETGAHTQCSTYTPLMAAQTQSSRSSPEVVTPKKNIKNAPYWFNPF